MTIREARFIEAYVADPTHPSEAAIQAGYSKKTAPQIASQLLKKLHALIEPRLKMELAKVRQQTGITKERIIREVARMALVDVGQMFDNHGNPIEIPDMKPYVRRAIQGFEFEENFLTVNKGQADQQKVAVGYTKKFKLADKLRACELLAKLLGHLSEEKGSQFYGPIIVQNFTDRAPKEEPLTIPAEAI